MRLSDQIKDHQNCLRQAARLLDAPCTAVSLTWGVEQALQDHLRLVSRHGVSMPQALMTLDNSHKGQWTDFGLDRYTLTTPERTVDLVHVQAPSFGETELHNFWVLPEADVRLVYRFARRLQREQMRISPPVMRDETRELLWANTISFLKRGQDVLQKYSVPRKRGLLLLGKPGNGKTTACRWLSYECQRRGLSWRSVSVQQFQRACRIQALFDLPRSGIILFDDFDQALWNRGDEGADFNLATFLTELDGVNPKQGVVYLFTSNARLRDLDPAFRRPGRIDVVVQFDNPDRETRREFIEQRWHKDICRNLDLETVSGQTAGMSFAELEELRKLIVLHFLDHGEWNWPAAWETFHDGRPKAQSQSRLGFQAEHSRSPTSTTAACLDD